MDFETGYTGTFYMLSAQSVHESGRGRPDVRSIGISESSIPVGAMSASESDPPVHITATNETKTLCEAQRAMPEKGLPVPPVACGLQGQVADRSLYGVQRAQGLDVTNEDNKFFGVQRASPEKGLPVPPVASGLQGQVVSNVLCGLHGATPEHGLQANPEASWRP